MTDIRCSSGSGPLPCPICKKLPGTKVGPPAMARCITPGCFGRERAAETIAEWNERTRGPALAQPQAAVEALLRVRNWLDVQFNEPFKNDELAKYIGIVNDALANPPQPVSAAQGAPDQRLTEDMTLAHNARKTAIEECKRLIEESQETFSETHEGSRRHLTPRKHGNSAGLAYADGIRALSAVTPSPGPGDVAIPDYDSAARALGFRQISEGGKWWVPDPLWHPSYLGRWDTAEDIFKSWGPSLPSTTCGGGA